MIGYRWEDLYVLLNEFQYKLEDFESDCSDEKIKRFADDCADGVDTWRINCKRRARSELTSSRKSIKSDYSDEEYWYPEETHQYVVQIENRKYEDSYYTYLTEKGNWLGKKQDAKIFTNINEAEYEKNDLQKYFYDEGMGASYWVFVKEVGAITSSRKPIKSDFDDNGNWVDDKKPVKKEDMHGGFRKLSQEEHDKLKPQVEEELDRWMSRKHFGLDKEVYDETVEYIISLFGEDNYAPKDVKEAVSSWYNDTLDSFPEMLKGKGDKRKIASAAYLKQIKSSHCIKSSRKSIKSSTY